MIEAHQLSKRYEDGVLGLDRLDLEIGAGKIYALLGANGAGKSTTINLFLGFIEPTSGAARIGGIEVMENPLAAKRLVGYLSENVTMYPNFTARQNLEFFARLRGRPRLSREESRRALADVGLDDSAHEQRVRAFSKGMRQKLGIAVATIGDPEALILDEPMSGLDPTSAAEFVAFLRRLRDAGKAILLSTHDIFRAKHLADRVGIMRAGRKVAELAGAELADVDLERTYRRYMEEPVEPAS